MPTPRKQRITLFTDSALAKQARAQAILEEISFSTLVERALNKYLPKATVIKKAISNIDEVPD